MQYVLHADDDELDRITLQRLIHVVNPAVKYLGFENGLALMQYLGTLQQHQIPEFIFLDLRMPIWDGIKTLKAIKSDSKYSGISVYMWSLADSANEMQLCTRLGAREFLQKPTNDEEWAQFEAFLEDQIGKLTL